MTDRFPQDCPFCRTDGALFENGLAYVRSDKYPVSPGHVLIIPKRHVADFFLTTAAERAAMLTLLDEAKSRLDREHGPAGYNVGVNVGEVAGQTIFHVHLHLIPRYPNDTDNPRGGVRGVIPSKQSY
jgi:diadenosine tetraphosphate (Ap4A) HIT family hydrolase